MKVKAAGRVEIKDSDRGEVAVVFSTLKVIDADGDVTLPGAFEDGASTRISAYGHTSWQGALPVGKGTIRELKTEAVMEGAFFMDTAGGRETFTVVKEIGDQQEWSYGYDPIEFSFGEQDDQRVRFLRKLKVHEVSPVLLGAGVNTRTLSAKGGMTFSEHIESVVADVDALITRATEVVALRAEKGKGIAESSADLLSRLSGSLKRLDSLLSAPPTDESAEDVANELARFLKLSQECAA